MGAKIAAGVLLLFGGITLVCVGVVFAGYAIYAAFVPAAGIAWAAAIAAAILLVFPILVVALLGMRRRGRVPRGFKNAEGTPENAALAFLAVLAKDRPLIALVLSALLGVASTVLRKGGKRQKPT